MNTLLSNPRRWLRRVGLALSIGLALLAGTAHAQDDAPGRVGRIGETQGTVWMLDRNDNEWVAAQRNRPMTRGDRLATDAGGRVEVQIGSTTLRLDGQTEVTLRELDDAGVLVAVDRGTLAMRVRSSEVARELQVQTDAGRVLPQTAGHYRIDVEQPGTVVGVWSGAVRFDAPDSALDVRAGQRAEFWREGNTTHYTWSSPPQDPFSDWVLAQDRADDQRLSTLDREISPEMTGVDDLGRYGRWDNHPEYGAIWAPTNVAPGWAPYRYGQWTYMAPWGWTWVDDAPWGFAPFHYGRWVQWNGRWGWTPGRYAARPVYAPALVAWVGGGNVSVGVTVGGPPYVGWVPLAPRERYVPGFRYAPRWRDHYDPYYGPGPRPPNWRAPDRGHGGPFLNERLPGGITVVPSDILRHRERISDRVIADPGRSREIWNNRRGDDNFRPPPPASGFVGRPGNDRPPSRVVDTNIGNNRDGSSRDGRPWPGRTIDSDGFRGRDNLPGTVPSAVLPRERDRDGNGRDDRLDRNDRNDRDRDRGERERIDRERLERSRGNDRDGNGVPDNWRTENPGGGLRNRDGSPANVVIRPQPAQPVVPAQQPRAMPSPEPRPMRAPEPQPMRAPEPRAMPQPVAPAPRVERAEPPRADRGGDRGGERARIPQGPPGRDKSGADR